MALGNINDIETFVAVARCGSFTVAGKQLGLTRSAVGKAIVRLEARLGVRLLNRAPRSVSLTDDGAALFARSTPILEELEEVERLMAARGVKPGGQLRLSVPVALGHRYVLPVAESFLDAWAWRQCGAAPGAASRLVGSSGGMRLVVALHASFLVGGSN